MAVVPYQCQGFRKLESLFGIEDYCYILRQIYPCSNLYSLTGFTVGIILSQIIYFSVFLGLSCLQYLNNSLFQHIAWTSRAFAPFLRNRSEAKASVLYLAQAVNALCIVQMSYRKNQVLYGNSIVSATLVKRKDLSSQCLFLRSYLHFQTLPVK